jgi:hypothetical protein
MKEVANELWKVHVAESRYKDRAIHKEWRCWLRGEESQKGVF